MQEFGDIFSFESATRLFVWGSVAFLLLYALAIVIAVTIRRPRFDDRRFARDRRNAGLMGKSGQT
jgi:hypothetical protein